MPLQLLEYVGADIVVGVPFDTKDIEEESKKSQHMFESFMQEHRVPQSTTTTEGLSCGWLAAVPNNGNFVGSYGRVFDAIVMNRPNGDTSGAYRRAMESGLFESGRPILLAPPAPPKTFATNVMIAWNRSTEQARAIALALPLLHTADRVTVLKVNGGAEVSGPSADHLVQYLTRNEIKSDLMTVELDGGNTGEAILTAAQSINCDLLIKGAYTQSRLRQMIFGGATQHILNNATLPVLLAN